MLGEVYLYEVANLLEAFAAYEGAEIKATLTLVDMMLTQEPFAIRQVAQVGENTFALCQENNKVSLMQHNPQLKAQQNLQATAKLLQELEMEDL